MLKIRKPQQAPSKFVCQYEKPASKEPMKEKGKNKPRYQGRFVKESFGDKFEVHPGQEFVKEWTYRNAGEVEWPNDVVFMQTSGDNLGAQTVKIT